MAIIRLISMNDKKYEFGDEHEYQQLQSGSNSSSERNSYNGTLPSKSESSFVESTRGKARHSSQILALVPVYLLQICYGMNTGFPAILTPQLRENCSEFPIDQEQESWIVSIDNLATPFICILSGFLQQKFGPLRVLMFACLPYSLGWLTVFISSSVYHLYLSRLLVGVSHALLTTTVYTVEISSKEMRGTYSLLESVLRCFGCLLIYTLGFAFRWRQIAMFAPIVPLSAFICALWMAPESPVFLLAKKRTVDAHEALHKLYGSNYRVTEEVEIIQENLSKLRENRSRKISYIRNLRQHPEIYQPFFIIVTLSIIQQFSGMSILRTYVVKIFDQVFHTVPNGSNISTLNITDCSKLDGFGDGSISKEAYISAIIIGLVRLLASLLLSRLLRDYCRRSMYFASAALTITSLACFATCIVCINSSTIFRWAALVTACLLVFSVQLGIQTLPSLLSGELFPSDVRAFGKGLTRSATCGFMLISLKVYPILSANLGVHGTFFLFSVVLLLSLPIVYCILPETKDMGLEMIPSYFTPNKTIFYVDLTEPNSKPEQQKNPEIIA